MDNLGYVWAWTTNKVLDDYDYMNIPIAEWLNTKKKRCIDKVKTCKYKMVIMAHGLMNLVYVILFATM
jgi:hypothetical protein